MTGEFFYSSLVLQENSAFDIVGSLYIEKKMIQSVIVTS